MAIAIQKDFTSLTLGQIHQLTLEAVDKLCRQHKFFSDIMNQKSKFDKACKKSYLEIKCKKPCSGNCSKKKKSKAFLEKGKKKKTFKFFKKKKFRGRSNDQRCYICNKKGHFSKNCPQKKDKAIRLISTLNLSDSEEVESLYSEQSSADEETAFALAISSEESAEEFSDSETEKFPVLSTQDMLLTNTTTPQPCVDIQLLPSKYNKAIKVIAYLDTGAQKTMMIQTFYQCRPLKNRSTLNFFVWIIFIYRSISLIIPCLLSYN